MKDTQRNSDLDDSTESTLATMDLAIIICMVDVMRYRAIFLSSPDRMWEACSPRLLLRLSGRDLFANDAVKSQ
jgi:hypothetical protein